MTQRSQTRRVCASPHALRTVKDYLDTVEYIHWTPVRRGLVKRPEGRKWSTFHEYGGRGFGGAGAAARAED